MRDRDVDLARLQSRKDAVMAYFQARATRWGHVQSAGLAAEALAVMGVLSG